MMRKRTNPKLKALAIWASLLFGAICWLAAVALVGALAGWLIKSL